MAMSRNLQRALWVARVVTVGLGLLVVVALLNQQSPSLLAQELPPGAERLGPGFGLGPEIRAGEGVGDDEGIRDYGQGAATEESDRAAQQEVAFRLDRIAQLLGWGREEDANPTADEYDPDRIRVKDWRPLAELSPGPRGEDDGAPGAGPTTDWEDSALLRAFLARFGAVRTTPSTATTDVDGGEMKDFEAATAAAMAAATTTTTLMTAPGTNETGQPEADAKALPLLAVCPMNGVITTQESENGAIAMRIFEYAATWLVSRGVGVQWRTPLVPAGVLRVLSPLFERLSVASLEQLPPSCGQRTGTWALGRAAALGERDVVNIPSLPTRFLDPEMPLVLQSGVLLPRLLSSQLPSLREELSLRPELRQAAAAVLELCRQRVHGEHGAEAASTTPTDGESAAARPRVSFVAVHARKNDIAPWLSASRTRKRPPATLDADYFRSAIEHVRAQLRARDVTPVFVVATDDAVWVRDNLPTDGVCVQHVGADDNAVNLAVLAACPHAILDHSAAALASLIVGPRQVDAGHPDAIVVAPEDVATALGSEHAESWKYL